VSSQKFRRREVIQFGAAMGAITVLEMATPAVIAQPAPQPKDGFRLATFEADVTPPLGHPLIGGLRPPAKAIADRLTARGVVLLGNEQPVLIVALDWCELRNQAYDDLRDVLAKAAGTTRERVVLTCNHQHDAPFLDPAAQSLLEETGLTQAMYLPEF
jgi:hypothetical protein